MISNSQTWYKLKLDPFTGVHHSTFAHKSVEKIIRLLPQLLGGEIGKTIQHVHIDTGRWGWYYQDPEVGDVFIKFYAKVNGHLKLREQIKLARQPKKAFQIHCALQRKGLNIPQVLFFGEQQKQHLFKPSMFIYRWMKGYTPLKEICFDWFKRNPVTSERQNLLITKLMMSIFNFHQKGYSHGDLNPYNVLIHTDNSDRNMRFGFTDFDYSKKRIGPYPSGHMINDLVTLAAMLENVIPRDLFFGAFEAYLSLFNLSVWRTKWLKHTFVKKLEMRISEYHLRFEQVTDGLFKEAAQQIKKDV